MRESAWDRRRVPHNVAESGNQRENRQFETHTALLLLGALRHGGTVGGDKGYDVPSFVAGVRALAMTPHIARKVKGSAIDGRTTRHPGYAISQRIRKRVEEIFGWTKTVGGGRKLRYLGLARNQCWAELTTATYNLVRIANLLPAAT